MNPRETPPALILVVVISIAFLSAIGVGSICLSMFFKNYSDPVAFNAVVLLTGTLTGSLTGLLVNTRSTPKNGNGDTGAPPVQIVQPDNKPVPVVEQTKPPDPIKP